MLKKQKLLSSAQILTISASICVSSLLFPTVSNAEGNFRISGLDRYETSMNILKHLGSKDEIYIATGKNFPDALSIGPVSHIQEKPLLLIKETDSEIKSLKEAKIKKITIIGGTNSISKNFENKLKKDFEITRISGKDRYETSRKIAQLVNNKKIGVATGETYPDALVASSYLGKNKMPLILIDNNKNVDIPKDKEAIYTFGGSSSVNKTYGKRISGKDRYETSRKIADEFKDYENIIIVSGENFADALSSAPLGKKYNAPIILAKGNKIDENSKDILKKAKKVVIVGGETSISKSLEKDIASIRTAEVEKPSLKPNDKPSIENNELKKAKDELGKRIEDLKKIEKNLYTKNSYNSFNDKIVNAEKKLKEENNIKEIKSTFESLKEIEKLLVKKGDIQKLEKAIENASDEVKKTDVYTEASIKKLEKELEEIKKNDFENLNETQTKNLIKKLDDVIKALDKKIIQQETLADNFNISDFEKISVKDINSPSDEEIEQLKNKIQHVERIEKIENNNEIKIIFTDNSSKVVNYSDVFKTTPVAPEEPESPGELKKVKIKKPGTYSYKKIEIEEDADSKTWLDEIKKGNCTISVFKYKNQPNKKELKLTKEEDDGYKVGEKGEKNYLFIYGAKENEFISIEVKDYEKIYAKVVKDVFSQSNYSLHIINESELIVDNQGSEDGEDNKLNEAKDKLEKRIQELKNIDKALYTKDSYAKFNEKITSAENILKKVNDITRIKEAFKNLEKLEKSLVLKGNIKQLEQVLKSAREKVENFEKYTQESINNLEKVIEKVESKNTENLNETETNEIIKELEEAIKILKQKETPITTYADKFNLEGFEKILVKDINHPENEELQQLMDKIANISRFEKTGKDDEIKIIFTDNSSKVVNYSDVFETIPVAPEEPESPGELKKVKIKKPGTYSYKKIEIEEDADSKTWLDEIKKGNCTISVFKYKNQPNKKVLKASEKEVSEYAYRIDKKSSLFIYGVKEESEFISIKVEGYEKIYAKVVKDVFSSKFNYYLHIINESEIPSEDKTQSDSESSSASGEINKQDGEQSLNLKNIRLKKTIIDIENQVAIDEQDVNSREWLKEIENNNGKLKVLKTGKYLKASKFPTQNAYKAAYPLLLLYELENDDYVVAEVDGYEDVFFKIRKSVNGMYIDQVYKENIPENLLPKN